MGEVTNLNRFRKRKAREADEQRASENRRKHGRPLAEKKAERSKTAKLFRHLDGHKLDKPEN